MFFFEQAGYDVATAATGEEALERFEAGPAFTS